MMKRSSEFESLHDFGFDYEVRNRKKALTVPLPDYRANPNDIIVTHAEGAGSRSAYFSLDDILSGGTLAVNLDFVNDNSQATLAIDYTNPAAIAYFGSVYGFVSLSLENIRNTYPNGLLIVTAITGVNLMMYNNSDSYAYGGVPIGSLNLSNYELVQSSGGVYHTTFQILNFMTGLTWAILFLDGQPSMGASVDHMIQPKLSYLDAYYSTLNQYELNLLIPPYGRDNYWPRDAIATNNIVLEGAAYDAFLAAEQSTAQEADDTTSNVLWRKLYPHGQKILDSQDRTMEKLILSMGMSFDIIKRYQDHIKYAHTVGTDNYNHIPKNLVGLLANQWNWELTHDLNQESFDEYMYKTQPNYVTGDSAQKLSRAEINFERWRRVLDNIVFLYKKKGTREALKYFTNLYGVPERLLRIDEYVKAIGFDRTERLMISPSNIVVPVGGAYRYIDGSGYVQALTDRVYANTKYLNVNLDPIAAIEFEYYDWGWSNHSDIMDVNGNVVKLSGATKPYESAWYNRVLQATIPSDGTARYAASYPRLEAMKRAYYTGAATPLTLTDLQAYIDFLDDSWSVIATKLIPASSKVLSRGTVYKNPLWARQKHQFKATELDPRALPFNSGVTFDIPQFEANLMATRLGRVDVIEKVGKATLTKSAATDEITSSGKCFTQVYDYVDISSSVGKYMPRLYDQIDISTAVGEYLPTYAPVSSIVLPLTQYTGNTKLSVSPVVGPVAGQSIGSLSFIDYNDDQLIVSNERTMNITLTASNLSQSGYTKITTELFKVLPSKSVNTVLDTEYSITQVMTEGNREGAYRVSSTLGLTTGDKISIVSSYVPYLNPIVTVVYVDEARGEIQTSPKIGLLDIPIGGNGVSVDWMGIYRSSLLDGLHFATVIAKVTQDDVIAILLHIIDDRPTNYTQADYEVWSSWLLNYANEKGYDSTNLRLAFDSMYMNLSDGYLYGGVLLLEYMKTHVSWNLRTNRLNLIMAVAETQTRATFRKVASLFDWTSPESVTVLSNESSATTGGWALPTINAARGLNTLALTGTVQLGGLNAYNAYVLEDKSEYFWRYKAETAVSSAWTDVMSGVPVVSGVNTIDSGYDLVIANGIPYYGRYFTFMLTPSEAELTVFPAHNTAAPTVLSTSSVLLKWKGVADSDHIEVQFHNNGTGSSPTYSSSTAITSSHWETATTIQVQVNKNAGDDFVYALQTALDSNTFYWWRVNNFKSHLNIFGNNLEAYTSTDAKIFKTGTFTDRGRRDGEVQATAVAPSAPTKKGDLNESS